MGPMRFNENALAIAFESQSLSYGRCEVDLYNSGMNQILSMAAVRGHELYHFRMADLFSVEGFPYATMSVLRLPESYRGDPLTSYRALKVVEKRPVPLDRIDLCFARADDIRTHETPHLEILRSMEGHCTLIESIDATLDTCDKFELVRRLPDIPQPVTYAADTVEEALWAIGQLPHETGFFVLKDRFGYGCGAQVHRIAFVAPDLDALVQGHLQAYGQLLVQEFCPEVERGDIVVTFFDDELIAPMRRIPARDEWKTNASLGASELACELTATLEWIARAVREAFRECRSLSVDMLESGKVLEVNAFPGGKGLLRNYGISVGRIVVEKLEAELAPTQLGPADLPVAAD